MIDDLLGRAIATVALAGAACAALVLLLAIFGPVRDPQFETLRKPFVRAAAISFVALALLGWAAVAGWLAEPFGLIGAVVLLIFAARPWSSLTRRMRAERDARGR